MSSACSSIDAKRRSKLRLATYICQVTAIFIIIIACIVNLSFSQDNEALWSTLLSSAIGYLLPAPKIGKKDDAFLPNPSIKFIDAVLSEQHHNAIQEKLQTTIELTGEWEVALAEMMFPKSWFTIPKQGAKFTFTCQVDPIDAQSMPDFLKNINFSPLEQEVELEKPVEYYSTFLLDY